MYENMTYGVILNRMLDTVPPELDRREGSVIYNALAPAAVELTLAYQALDVILRETFADTASRPSLIKRCVERGITPYPATPAEILGVFTPETIDLFGRRFQTVDGPIFAAREFVEPGRYRLVCEAEGEAGNISEGILIPLDYIEGLETAEIAELAIPGAEQEETEHLRMRYFDSLNAQAYGGNIADYRQKTNSIAGVGGTKVYPCWDGGGTVKLVIVDALYRAPSDTLIREVQEAADPERLPDGKGLGFAPIGHTVTVEGAEEVPVDIETELAYSPGYDFESAKPFIEAALDGYYDELRREWERSDALIVRISQIESRLLGAEGVLDIQNTAINGGSGNLALLPGQIPVRGGFNGA